MIAPYRGVPDRRRLGDDRRRLRRAVRAAHRGARRARARSRSALRGQSLARDPSRGAGGGAGRADPRAHDRRAARPPAAGRRAAPRRSTRWTRSPTAPQTEASGMLVAPKHPRLPDYRAMGLPIQWDGERPASRACRRCSASTRPTCWPSSATTTRTIRGPGGAPCRPAIETLAVTALRRRPRRHGRAEPARGAQRDEHRDGRGSAALLRRRFTRDRRRASWSSPAAGDQRLLRGRRSQGARGHDRRGLARPARRSSSRPPCACSAARCRSSPRSRASRMAGGCELAVLSDFIVAERDRGLRRAGDRRAASSRASAAPSSCPASWARRWPRS